MVNMSIIYLKTLCFKDSCSIYLAYDSINKEFKVLKEYGDNVKKKYIKKEYNVVKCLNNNNIIKYYNMVDNVIHMEYSNMGSLTNFIDNNVLTENIKIKLWSDILNGLSYLHKLNIIHCDIKPDNILLFLDKNIVTAKICDFEYCQPNCRVGYTLDYTPYEFFISHTNISPAFDIFSFGVIMYQMETKLTPKRVYYTDSNTNTIKLNVTDNEFNFDLITNNVIKNLIIKCLHKNYIKRPSAKSILSKLNKNFKIYNFVLHDSFNYPLNDVYTYIIQLIQQLQPIHIAKWLTMSDFYLDYSYNFISSNITGFDLLNLTNDDLADLGIYYSNDKNKIFSLQKNPLLMVPFLIHMNLYNI